MGYIVINDEEYDALWGQPAHWLVVYIAIKRFMDYETRIAGKKRRLSEQYFREILEIEEEKGRHKKKDVSRKKIRCCVQGLVRIGLLEDRKSFVFFLPKADIGVVGSKDEGPMRGQKKGQKNRPRPIDTAESLNDEGTTSEDMRGPPHYINNNNYKKHNYYSGKTELRDEFSVSDKHLAYAQKHHLPSPHDEIEKFKNYHISKGTRFKNWDRAFYNWLINAKKFKAKETEKIKPSATLAHDEICEEVINGTRCSNIVTMLIKGKKKLCREHFKH